MSCTIEGTSFSEKAANVCGDFKGQDQPDLCDAPVVESGSTRTCNVSERECLVCDPRFQTPPAPYNSISGGGPLWYFDTQKGPFISAPQWALKAGTSTDVYAELEFDQVSYYMCRDTNENCDLVKDSWAGCALFPSMFVTVNTHEFKYLQPKNTASGDVGCTVDATAGLCVGSGLSNIESNERVEAIRAAPVQLSSVRCSSFVSGCNGNSSVSAGFNPTYTKLVNKSDGDCKCSQADSQGCIGLGANVNNLRAFRDANGKATTTLSDGASANDLIPNALLCCLGGSDEYPLGNVNMGANASVMSTGEATPGCADFSYISAIEGEYELVYEYVSQQFELGRVDSKVQDETSRCSKCFTLAPSSDVTSDGGWNEWASGNLNDWSTGTCRCDNDGNKYKSRSGGSMEFKTGSHSVTWSGRPDYSLMFAQTFCTAHASELESYLVTSSLCVGQGEPSTYAEFSSRPITRSLCPFMPTCAYEGTCNASNSTTTPTEFMASSESRMRHYPQFQIVNRYPKPTKCTYSEKCFFPQYHVGWDWTARIKDSQWYTPVTNGGSGQTNPEIGTTSADAWGDGANSCNGQAMFPPEQSDRGTNYTAIELGLLEAVEASAQFASFATSNVNASTTSSLADAKRGRQMGLNYGCVRAEFRFEFTDSTLTTCASSSLDRCFYELALKEIQDHCNAISRTQPFIDNAETATILKQYGAASYFFWALSIFYDTLYKGYSYETEKHLKLDLLALETASAKASPQKIGFIGAFMMAVKGFWPYELMGH